MRLSRPRTALAAIVALLPLAVHPAAAGQDHVLALQELRQDLRSADTARSRNLGDLERLLTMPAAQASLQKASLDRSRITAALATLSDEELSRLAERARAAALDVEGGNLTLALAVIGAIAVIIIVIAAVT